MFAHDSQVVVKSPDYVRGSISGKRRELDVTVRGRMGSAHVFLVFECRERRSGSGVSWIEQLATKRSDVGADRLIAVSTSLFSEAARNSAARLGVELRQLKEVDRELVFPWQGTMGALFFTTQSTLYHVTLRCRNLTSDELIVITFSDNEIDERLITWSKNGSTRSLRTLFNDFVKDPDAPVWRHVQIGNDWQRRSLVFQLHPIGVLTVQHANLNLPIVEVEYDVGLRIKMTKAETSDTTAYFDAAGTILAGAQHFASDVDDVVVETDVTWTPDGNRHWQRLSLRAKQPKSPGPANDHRT
jgi:hypothetical protein